MEILKRPATRISLLVVILALLVIFTPGKADASITRSGSGFDAEIQSALFHYARGDSGTEHPVEIDFSNLNSCEDYSIVVNRLNDEGQVTEILESVVIEADTDGLISFSYNFEGDFEEIGFPYEVKIEGERVMRGYVAEAPSEDFRNSSTDGHRGNYEALAVGKVPYNTGDGFLQDPEGQEQLLTQQGDYILLHYRFPFDSRDEEHEIRLYYENDKSKVLTISSEDIYNFQDGGDADADARRSFILLNTDGEIPGFVDQRADTAFTVGDNPFKADLKKGVYTLELYDTVNFEYYQGESVWLVGDRADLEWDLDAKRYSIREGNTIWWDVFRYTEEISQVYNEHIFLDIPRQENFGDELEESYQERTSIRYRVDDAIGVGEGGSINWSIKKTLDGDIVDWSNDVSGSEYSFTVEKDYTIRSPEEIQDALTDWLASFGLSDEAGQVIFVVITMIGVSLALAYYGATLAVLGIANFGLIGFFAIIGFLPLWLIIGLVMLAIALLVISLKGGE